MNLCFLNAETTRFLLEFFLSQLVRLSFSNSALFWEKPRKISQGLLFHTQKNISDTQGLLFHSLENAHKCRYLSVDFRVELISVFATVPDSLLWWRWFSQGTLCAECAWWESHLHSWLVNHVQGACPGWRQTRLPLRSHVQCRPGKQERTCSLGAKGIAKRISDFDQ